MIKFGSGSRRQLLSADAYFILSVESNKNVESKQKMWSSEINKMCILTSQMWFLLRKNYQLLGARPPDPLPGLRPWTWRLLYPKAPVVESKKSFNVMRDIFIWHYHQPIISVCIKKLHLKMLFNKIQLFIMQCTHYVLFIWLFFSLKIAFFLSVLRIFPTTKQFPDRLRFMRISCLPAPAPGAPYIPQCHCLVWLWFLSQYRPAIFCRSTVNSCDCPRPGPCS